MGILVRISRPLLIEPVWVKETESTSWQTWRPVARCVEVWKAGSERVSQAFVFHSSHNNIHHYLCVQANVTPHGLHVED